MARAISDLPRALLADDQDRGPRRGDGRGQFDGLAERRVLAEQGMERPALVVGLGVTVEGRRRGSAWHRPGLRGSAGATDTRWRRVAVAGETVGRPVRGEGSLASLGHGGPKLGRRHREPEHGRGAHPGRLAGPLRVGAGEEEHHRHAGMLPPASRRAAPAPRGRTGRLRRCIRSIPPRSSRRTAARSLDASSIWWPSDWSIEPSRARIEGSGWTMRTLAWLMGFILSGRAPAGANTGRCVILEEMRGDATHPGSKSATDSGGRG